MTRLRRVKSGPGGYEHWDVGDEHIIDTDYGRNGHEIRFRVKRGKFGWSVSVVNVVGQMLAPVSVGNYKGDNFDHVMALVKKFVSGIHGRDS